MRDRDYYDTVRLREPPVMKDTIAALFPPDVPPVLRWRLAMFAWAALVGIHIMWACGWLSRFGMGDGFANATEVKSLRRDMVGIQLQLLEQSLFDAKESECTAVDPVAHRYFSQLILTRSREYQELSGTVPSIPPCRILVSK